MTFCLDPCDFDPDLCHPWRAFYDPKLNGHCKYCYVITCVFTIKNIGCKVEALVNHEAEAEAEAFENHEAEAEAEARLSKI